MDDANRFRDMITAIERVRLEFARLPLTTEQSESLNAYLNRLRTNPWCLAPETVRNASIGFAERAGIPIPNAVFA